MLLGLGVVFELIGIAVLARQVFGTLHERERDISTLVGVPGYMDRLLISLAGGRPVGAEPEPPWPHCWSTGVGAVRRAPGEELGLSGGHAAALGDEASPLGSRR